MNVVFWGSSPFGLAALDALRASDHSLLAVLTTADKPKGRFQKKSSSPVKDWAVSHSIPCLDYTKETSAEIYRRLSELKPDVFAVVAFRHILPSEFLALPAKLPLNIHSSLLPRWRGAAPIHWAILEGDAKTGVTIMKMAEGLDAGDILAQKETAIGPEDDYRGLEQRLAQLGADALIETLAHLGAGSLKTTTQNENEVTYARKITKEDGRIDWGRPADQTHRRIRAFVAWPGSYFFFQGDRFLIHQAQVLPSGQSNAAPGTVLAVSEHEGIDVAAGGGILRITRIQKEGRSVLAASEFLRGCRMTPGQVLE